MRIALMLLIGSVGLGLGSAGCKKKEKAKEGGMVGEGSDKMGSAPAPAPTPAPPAPPEMAKHAGNCPSTVLGAETKAEVKGTDVAITITSADKDAIVAIQERTDELLKEKADGATGAAHDQKGTHGGGMGMCPVFFGEGGTAKAARDASGVTITVTPKIKPDELKAQIDTRIAKATEWVKANIKPGDGTNQGGVGGTMGDHGANHSGKGDGKGKQMVKTTGNCPSTVLGATTKDEVKGKAVVVSITATDKDAIAGIQKRTEQLLKLRTGRAAGTDHDQKGTRGGSKGICPVFVGDGGTLVSKKEAKGVTITITPKDKPEELKAQIDTRIAKAAEWVKANVKAGDAGNTGGVGGGKGTHGTNHSGKGDGKGKEKKG